VRRIGAMEMSSSPENLPDPQDDPVSIDSADEPNELWQGDMLNDANVDASEEADDSPPPFGLERFAGTEIPEDAPLPDGYREATQDKQLRLLTGPQGIIERTRIYQDMGMVRLQARVVPAVELDGMADEADNPVTYAAEAQHVLVASKELAYETPDGRADINLGMGGRMTMRFTGQDGTTSYAHYYYVPRQAVGSVDSSAEQPLVMRKDVNDPLVDISRFAPGDIPPLDMLKLQWEAEMQHTQQQQVEGVVHPIVGIEEAAYILDEVLPNAQPVMKHYEDLAGVMAREYATVRAMSGGETTPKPPEKEPTTSQEMHAYLARKLVLEQNDFGRSLYERVMAEYRQRQPASATADTIEVVDSTGVTTQIESRPYAGSASSHTFTRITRSQELSGEALVQALAAHDITLSRHLPAGRSVTLTEGTTIGYRREDGAFWCHRTIGINTGKEGDARTHRSSSSWQPSYAVIQTFRNYLFRDLMRDEGV